MINRGLFRDSKFVRVVELLSMRIIHRFCTNISSEETLPQELQALGVTYELTQGLTLRNWFLFFEVAEDHPYWAQVERLVASWNCVI